MGESIFKHTQKFRYVQITYLRETMLKNLEAAGISCTLILDSAVGYVMEQVDFVMVGAEGVVESGGIVNKVSVV